MGRKKKEDKKVTIQIGTEQSLIDKVGGVDKVKEVMYNAVVKYERKKKV